MFAPWQRFGAEGTEVVKETGFLARYRGREGELQQFSTKFFRGLGPAHPALDGTPYNLYRAPREPSATSGDESGESGERVATRGAAALAARLHCLVPEARLIVTFRDPVARTFSDYLFFARLMHERDRRWCFDRADGFAPTAAHFDRAMRRQLPALARCLRGTDGHDPLARETCSRLWDAQLTKFPLQVRGRSLSLLSIFPLLTACDRARAHV